MGSEPRRLSSDATLVVATVAAVVPVVVAAVRGAARGWLPTMDNGYTAIRVWDVFSTHPPLVGVAASPSLAAQREIHQPGALSYDLLAVPVRLFGRGWGIALGIAVINAVAIVGIAWLLRRGLGPACATVGTAVVALLVWSMGSEVLYDPWVTHATLLPYALFLVAVWWVMAGDVAALVPMVVAGSYAAQFHLSFVVPVSGLVATAAVVCAIRLYRRRRDRDSWPEQRPRVRRWGAITLVTGLICWAQPLIDLLPGNGEANLVALYRASRVELPQPGGADLLRVFGSTVALPPLWLPPSFGSPSFHPDGSGRPLGLAAAGLLLLAGLLVGLGWRAWRRGAMGLAAGALTGIAALAFGLLTLSRLPTTFGIVPYYVRFMWPLAAVVWLVVVLAVLDELRGTRFVRPGWVGLGAALVAVVAGLAALPTQDNGATSPRWSIEAVNEMTPEVIAAVEGQGPVVVDIPIGWPSLYVGPPLMGELQEAGLPFRTSSRIVSRQAGFHHEARPGEARVRLSIRGGSSEPRPGEELVTSWSSLSDDETTELDRLTDRLADVIEGRGVPLDPGAEEVFDHLELEDYEDEIEAAEADPEPFLARSTLWVLVRGQAADYVGHSLVDSSSFPSGLLERWAELAERRDTERVVVYLGPEPAAWPVAAPG